MDKIYSVTVRDSTGTALIAFLATLEKARLRSHIHRLQGMTASRPAYCPLVSQKIADSRARGQVVSPYLRESS